LRVIANQDPQRASRYVLTRARLFQLVATRNSLQLRLGHIDCRNFAAAQQQRSDALKLRSGFEVPFGRNPLSGG
jgi:hypothetical protein